MCARLQCLGLQTWLLCLAFLPRSEHPDPAPRSASEDALSINGERPQTEFRSSKVASDVLARRCPVITGGIFDHGTTAVHRYARAGAAVFTASRMPAPSILSAPTEQKC